MPRGFHALLVGFVVGSVNFSVCRPEMFEEGIWCDGGICCDRILELFDVLLFSRVDDEVAKSNFGSLVSFEFLTLFVEKAEGFRTCERKHGNGFRFICLCLFRCF